MPASRSSYAGIIAFAYCFTANVHAREVADPGVTSATNLKQVIVTGTHSQAKTETYSVSPIDVVSAQQLAETGTTDLAAALARVLPSINFPRPAINSGSTASRPAQLRGMSPDEVLVLVDGKRWHTSSVVGYQYTVGRGSAPADLNSIPMTAVDHIEVLRDGAAAQYGSDAIAGVINVILKHGPKGGSVEANYGLMSKGDGEQNGVAGDQGFRIGDEGWARLAFVYQHQSPTNRSGADLRNPDSPTYGEKDTPQGDPKGKTYQLMGNVSIPLAEEVELYGHADVSNRTIESNGYYRTKYVDNPSDPASFSTLNTSNVDAIYPNGYLPWLRNTLKDRSLVGGLKGSTDNGWFWDFSANYGQNKTEFAVDHSLNVALYEATGSTPTHFYAGDLTNTQELANFDVSKEFSVNGLENPVTFAAGVEYRHEKYKVGAGDEASYYTNPNSSAEGQSQFFAGYSPTDAGTHTRHNYAVYSSLESDVTRSLSLGLAGRYENYSDFGPARSGKLSARYQFTDSFAVRGTISNGFRAPSLAQSYFSATTTLPRDGQLVSIGTLPATSVAAMALGAKALKPEKSTNYSIGAVWTPNTAFNATLDFYRINIRNQIVLSDQISSDAVAAYLQRVAPESGIVGGQYFTNGVDTKNEGANLMASYRMILPAEDTLDFSLGYSYSKSEVTHIDATPEVLADNGLAGTSIIGRASLGVIEDYAPRSKINLAANYAHGPFTAGLTLTRYGTYSLRGDTAAQDQTFSASWLTGFNVAYQFSHGISVSVGGDNIFDVYPDKLKSTSMLYYYGIAPYPTISPYGFNGAYYYAKVKWKW